MDGLFLLCQETLVFPQRASILLVFFMYKAPEGILVTVKEMAPELGMYCAKGHCLGSLSHGTFSIKQGITFKTTQNMF